MDSILEEISTNNSLVLTERLFESNPYQDIIQFQKTIHKQLITKNNQLKDIFSTRYQELLDCSTIVNGITKYTASIIQISDYSAKCLSKLNLSVNPQIQQKQISQIVDIKSLVFKISKKIDKLIQNGEYFKALVPLDQLETILTGELQFYIRTQKNQLKKDLLQCKFLEKEQFSTLEVYMAFEHLKQSMFDALLKNINFDYHYQKVFKILIYLKQSPEVGQYRNLTNQSYDIQKIQRYFKEWQDWPYQSEKLEFSCHNFFKQIEQNIILTCIKEDGTFNFEFYEQFMSDTTQLEQLDPDSSLKFQLQNQWLDFYKKDIQELADQIVILTPELKEYLKNEELTIDTRFLEVWKTSLNNLNQKAAQYSKRNENLYRIEECLEFHKEKLLEVEQIVEQELKKQVDEKCNQLDLLKLFYAFKFWNKQKISEIIKPFLVVDSIQTLEYNLSLFSEDYESMDSLKEFVHEYQQEYNLHYPNLIKTEQHILKLINVFRKKEVQKQNKGDKKLKKVVNKLDMPMNVDENNFVICGQQEMKFDTKGLQMWSQNQKVGVVKQSSANNQQNQQQQKIANNNKFGFGGLLQWK